MSETLTGAEKAAALITALDPVVAAKLLASLPDDDLLHLVTAAAGIEQRGIAGDSIRAIAAEFARDLESSAGGPRRDRPVEALKSALERGAGADRWVRVATRAGVTGPRSLLRTLTPDRVAAALLGEPDSVATILLREMEPVRAAEILKRLPPERQTEIVTSLASPDAAPARVVERVLSAITSKASRTTGDDDDQKRLRGVAEILTMLPPGSDKVILDRIRDGNESTAGRIRELMFTIDDLPLLPRKAIQKVISTVDARSLALILKAATPAIKSQIMDNVSESRRQQIQEEKDALGAVSLSDVVQAQKVIVAAAWKLIESGEATLRRGEAQAVVE